MQQKYTHDFCSIHTDMHIYRETDRQTDKKGVEGRKTLIHTHIDTQAFDSGRISLDRSSIKRSVHKQTQTQKH